MRYVKWIVVLVVAVVLIGVAVSQNKPSDKKQIAERCDSSDTIKIGAVYTFTGNLADIGESFREGTEIAKDQINAEGGINGKKIEIIYEDAPDFAGKPGVDAVHKLVSQNKVCSVLDFVYGSLGGINSFAEQNQTPILNPLDSSDKIAEFGDWVFSSGVYDDGIGTHVAEFARKEKGIDKVAMLVGQDEYLLSVASGFEKTFKAEGGQVTDREEFVIGTNDFKTQISKLMQSGADTIFIGHIGEGGIIVRQARELGFKGTFLGTDTFSLADVQRVAGPLLNDNLYFALWRNFDATTPEQDEFSKAYEQKYNKKAGDYLFYNVLGYDGLKVMAEAISKSDMTGTSIKTQLYNIKDFQGLSGPITITPEGINKDPKSAMVMYKENKIVRYSK